jgi:amino acid transporter
LVLVVHTCLLLGAGLCFLFACIFCCFEFVDFSLSCLVLVLQNYDGLGCFVFSLFFRFLFYTFVASCLFFHAFLFCFMCLFVSADDERWEPHAEASRARKQIVLSGVTGTGSERDDYNSDGLC